MKNFPRKSVNGRIMNESGDNTRTILQLFAEKKSARRWRMRRGKVVEGGLAGGERKTVGE